MTVPPPAAPPPLVTATVPPPPAKGGCWKWGVIGCLATLALIAIFAGVVVLIVFGTIKSTDVYRRARATAQQDPRVIAILGSPIRAGLWVSGSVNVHNRRGEADIEFPIVGPKGRARVHAVATRDASGWHYSELTVSPQNGAIIDLLKP